jgi:hypothetical protein
VTTIATWNLHHMGREIEISNGVPAVIAHVRPDVLVLTEYVDRGGREPFENALKEIGYMAGAVSLAGVGQNQVLMASRVEQVAGTLNAPDVDEAARTNFLHQWLPTLELHVIGFRAPYYQAEDPRKLKPYWEGLKAGALTVAQARTVHIGDFNWCPGAKEQDAEQAVAALVAAGYRLVPEGGGVDRALVSAALEPRGWQVVEGAAGFRLTGEGGLSDHPMLVVEVE